MQKYNGQLIRQFASSITGNAASGVTVTVRRQSDDGLAALYVENNIAGATLSNPITTTSTGHFAFYAPDDVYTLTFSDSTPVQVIQLQDVAELQAQFDAAVLNAGYIPSGTFSAGATLTQANQVLSDGSSYWRWDGGFPKVVTAGSEPTPTGVGNWIVLSDFALRGDLAAAESTVLVGGVAASRLSQTVIQVAHIKALPVTGLVNNQQYSVASFYADSDEGGGDLVWSASYPKSKHNGVTVYDPLRIQAWSGTQSDLATLFDQSASGVGCFVRKFSELDATFAGVVGDGIVDNQLAMQQALDTNELVRLRGSICVRLNSRLYLRRGHKGILGDNAVFDTVGGTEASGSYFDYFGTSSAIEFQSQDVNNRTVVGVRLEHFGIKVRTVNGRGIDYTQATYCNFNNVWVRLLGSFTTGFYGKGNGQGSAPYYNVFDGCMVFGNNDRVASSGQVGFYGQGDGIFLADGPNANTYTNIRHLVGIAYGFIFESGGGNMFSNITFESIQESVFSLGRDDTAAEGRCQENTVVNVWGEGTSTARIADIRGLASRNTITQFFMNSASNIIYTDTTPTKDNFVSALGTSLAIEFNGKSFPAGSVVPIGYTAPNWAAVGFGGITPAIKGYPSKLIVNCFGISGTIVGSAVVRVYRAGLVHPILTATITDANRYHLVHNIGYDVTLGYNRFDRSVNSSLEVVVTTSSDWNQTNACINATVELLST